MLMLVHPPTGGNGTDPPKHRKGLKSPKLFITDEEAQHFRAAVRGIAHAYGSVRLLAESLGLRSNALSNKRRPSAALVLAVARAGKMYVEAVLGARLTEAGRCPTCGARAGEGRLVRGGAS